MSYNIAVIAWFKNDGIASMISDELIDLGHTTQLISPQTTDFKDIDIVFSFGPYGEFLPIPQKLQSIPLSKRPIFVQWNTEGLPDLRLPWVITGTLGGFRSLIGRTKNSKYPLLRKLANTFPLNYLNNRMFRFRYLGDYHYAQKKGWLDVFADSSNIYGALHNHHGLPTKFVPWGASPRNYSDLNLVRDIDVLWMGNRNTRRRSDLIDRIRNELNTYGVKMHVVDSIENAFVYGDERTVLLNRAKITLNLTRTWYDDNYSRFALAIPNRSLIVSETLLPHCPPFEAGKHYVSAPIEQLTENILYYLGNDNERHKIVENAYHLVTTKLTFKNSIQTVLNSVDDLRTLYPTRTFALRKAKLPGLDTNTSEIPPNIPSEPQPFPEKNSSLALQSNALQILMIAPPTIF